MPIYQYRCRACKYEFDEYQSIKAEPLTECPLRPVCNGTIFRVIHAVAVVDKTPKTLGTLAEKNSKAMGQEQREIKTNEIKRRVPTSKSDAPPWRPNTTGPDMTLSKLNPKEADTYIKTGIKPIGK